MYNQNQQLSPQNFVKIIVIIHLALFMGQALFAAVCIFIINNGFLKVQPGSDPLFYLAPALTILGGYLSGLMFKLLSAKIPDKETLKQKISQYTTALIIRYAFVEGASLFCTVCFFVTHNYIYLIWTGFNVLRFISFRPTRFQIQEDLNLEPQEQAEMDGNPL